MLVILPKQTLVQVLQTFRLPLLRRELVNDGLERLERAKRLISGKMVLRLGGATGNANGFVIVADADVVLAEFLLGGFVELGEGDARCA